MNINRFPLTIQTCGLCSIINDNNDGIKSATWILGRPRKGFNNIIQVLFVILNALRMKLEHIIDIDMLERRLAVVKVLIRHLIGGKCIQEGFEVMCKIGCIISIFYQ